MESESGTSKVSRKKQLQRLKPAEDERKLQMKLQLSYVDMEGKPEIPQLSVWWIFRPAALAQLVEQLTLNQWVPGSSP